MLLAARLWLPWLLVAAAWSRMVRSGELHWRWLLEEQELEHSCEESANGLSAASAGSTCVLLVAAMHAHQRPRSSVAVQSSTCSK